MVDHRLKAYLGSGPVADRPATPDTQPGVLVIWRDPETHELTFWNTETVAWETDPTILADAPVDGMFYTRKDGAWVGFEVPDLPLPPADDGKLYGITDGIWTEIIFPVIPTVDVQEAPEDGDSYMRKNGDWFKYVPPEATELPDNIVYEAPEDDGQYVRSNGAWVPVEIPDGAGFPEAPQDGKIYGRKDGAWAEVLINDSGTGDGGTLPPETPGQMAHKFWRVYCRANNGDGYTGLTEVYFRDVAGVEFPPTDGVIIKSGEAPNGAIGPAVQAFDRNVGNRWEVPVAVGAWIGIQYAAAVKVRRLSLTSGNQYPAQMMKNFDIQWSDDGITWTTRWSQDNVTAWGISETRNFADPVEDPVSTAIPSPTGKAGKVLTVAANGRELEWAGGTTFPRFRFMRIQKIANYGDGASAREVRFLKGGVDLPKPTIIRDTSSGEYPFARAIDGLLTNFWSTYGVGANVIVDLDFGAMVEMDQFVWMSRTDSYQQAPSYFEMCLSEDGIIFNAPIVITYTLAGWTVGGATRTVTFPKNTPAGASNANVPNNYSMVSASVIPIASATTGKEYVPDLDVSFKLNAASQVIVTFAALLKRGGGFDRYVIHDNGVLIWPDVDTDAGPPKWYSQKMQSAGPEGTTHMVNARVVLNLAAGNHRLQVQKDSAENNQISTYHNRSMEVMRASMSPTLGT